MLCMNDPLNIIQPKRPSIPVFVNIVCQGKHVNQEKEVKKFQCILKEKIKFYPERYWFFFSCDLIIFFCTTSF